MKTFLSSILFLALVAVFASPSHAQAKMGFGVGINSSVITPLSFDFDGAPFTSIYIPIASDGFRVEPEVGVGRFSSKNGVDASATVIRVGAGLFAVKQLSSDTQAYFGVRGGVNINTAKIEFSNEEEKETTTDFFAVPALGGEHFFGDNFSLGAEAQVNLLFFGKEDDDDPKTNYVATNGVFFVRWYFDSDR